MNALGLPLSYVNKEMELKPNCSKNWGDLISRTCFLSSELSLGREKNRRCLFNTIQLKRYNNG